MIPLPAGEVLERRRVWNAAVEQLLPKRKKWFYIKVASPLGRGWAIFEDGKSVYAAHFDDGFSEYCGSDALGRIASALRDCEVEVGLLGGRIARLFAAMHPEVIVDGVRDVRSAFAEARALDAVDEAVGRIDVRMFTEEWEEGTESGAGPDGEAEDAEAPESEDADGSAEEIAEPAEEAKVRERKWVVNFEEFVYGLKGFTGVCRGREGDFQAEVYLKNGEIVGAVVKDGDLVLKGEAALFYLDRPLEVELAEGDFEVPEGAECGEDRRSVEALYMELDRKSEGRL